MLNTSIKCGQNGASRDSSQTSALPLEASSASSSIESRIYSRCANRSHSVNVGFSRSCFLWNGYLRFYAWLIEELCTWRMRKGSRDSNAMNLLRLNRMLKQLPESLLPFKSCKVKYSSSCKLNFSWFKKICDKNIELN